MQKNITRKNVREHAPEVTTQKLSALMDAHKKGEAIAARLTIGLDLGDRASCWCVLDENGEVIGRGVVVTDRQSMEREFKQFPVSRVALEVGTHSPWVSRILKQLGHEVIVANARRVKLISESSRKNDRLDAEFLARLARADQKLLAPVRHRSEAAQADLTLVRVRAQLVELRTQAVNAARGLVKSFGQRLAKRDAASWKQEHAEHLAPEIRPHIERLLRVAETLTGEIESCDEEMKKISRERYAQETERVQQVPYVGPVTALSYVLTLEDPQRFKRSRDVGSYLGLRPRSDQSGETNPEMRICKEGDVYLRKLLVQCAQGILSPRSPVSDLKIWGAGIAAKGKKKAKRRAVVAVARKLATLLHRLWVSGERYYPMRAERLAARHRLQQPAAVV